MKAIIFALAAILISAGWVLAAEVGPTLLTESDLEYRIVIGNIDKVKSGLVYVKTDEGARRALSVKRFNREGFKEIKPGEAIELTLNEGNQIIDIRKTSAADDPSYQSVTGTIETFSPLEKRATLKTADNQKKVFKLKSPVTTKLLGVKKGERVTFTLDEQSLVMDAFEYDED